MPYFAQEPLSYLTLPTIKNAYKAFSIKINFRPDNVDGKEVQPQMSLTVKRCSLLFDTGFLCWLLMLSVLCCVLCLSYFSSCIISLRLLSLPSLPHLSPSHPRGGKVSYCTPVSLSAWEPQELKSERWQFCFFFWLHQTFTCCIQLRADEYLEAVKDGAWPLFSYRLFRSWSQKHFSVSHQHCSSLITNLLLVTLHFTTVQIVMVSRW